MNCSKCGAKNANGLSFCEDCGTKLVAPKTMKNLQKGETTNSVVLKVPKPFRWLFGSNYGTLSISGDHLVFDLNPRWSLGLISVIAKVMSWGFDPLSIFRAAGNSQLKNLNTAATVRLNWIVWDINIMTISAAGFFGFYIFAAEQRDEILEFIEAVRNASNEVKYVVSK